MFPTRTVKWSLLIALVSGFLWAAFAQPKLTPEKVVDLKIVTSAVIQPQGNFIAYVLRTPWKEEEKPGGAHTELWVAPVNGGEARPFVVGSKPVSGIEWAPDGNAIGFLSRSGKTTQVFEIPVDGGEARQLSHAPRSVRRFHYSPDGALIAFTMRDEAPKEIRERRKKGFDQKVEGSWDSTIRLYVENPANGEINLISRDDVAVWDFTWTADGQGLIYRASRKPFTDDSYMFTQNYRVLLAGGKGELLAETVGKLGVAKESPDGNYVAWLGAVSLNDPYNGSLFLQKSGQKRFRNLMKNFPGTAVGFAWRSSRSILLTTIEKTRTYLYQISIPSGKIKKISPDVGPLFHDVTFSDETNQIAFVGDEYNHPGEVYLVSLRKWRVRRLTNSNPELNNMAFGRQETISWKSVDGLKIYGVLIKPVGFKPGVRYPLQVQVHGGPEGARLDGWNTYYSRYGQMLSQRGYMVLLPNYRGSIGRGVAFAKGDHRDLMGKEFQDILTGIDSLAARGWIDPNRVGIGGGSYGGYASAWAATRYSDRFKAAIVLAGISNQISKGGTSDIPAENALVHWDLWLYDHFDFVWDRSPLKYIHQAHTPTLIGHGEKDLRVPPGQALELYRGLKFVRTPVELVYYPREHHGLRERAHQIDFCRRALAWYRKYLKGEGRASAE